MVKDIHIIYQVLISVPVDQESEAYKDRILEWAKTFLDRPEYVGGLSQNVIDWTAMMFPERSSPEPIKLSFHVYHPRAAMSLKLAFGGS